MARSRKKNPIIGITTMDSDKPFKVAEHRRERRKTAVALRAGDEMVHPKSFGNPWSAPKDGKQYWNDPRAIRK